MTTQEDGYTILEALCAFAILASILVLLYGVGGKTSRLLVETSDDARVALLVQSKLDELSAMRGSLPRTDAGQFAGTGVRWRLESSDAIPEAERLAKFRLQDVVLTFSWPGSEDQRYFSVQTRHFGIDQ